MKPPVEAKKPDVSLFVKTLLDGTHSLKAIREEFCISEDAEINLALHPKNEWSNFDGKRVMLIPGVKAYLESDDDLTHAVIDQMEMAMEQAYHVTAPWCITSRRKGEAGKNLAVDYFYLMKDE